MVWFAEGKAISVKKMARMLKHYKPIQTSGSRSKRWDAEVLSMQKVVCHPGKKAVKSLKFLERKNDQMRRANCSRLTKTRSGSVVKN